MSSEPLPRELSTTTLTLYGVGVMVGAGIFVLVGEVVAEAGALAWMSFIVASVAALPTALSYAELSGRYPRSAGEAVFADRASGRPAIAFLVGFLVIASGVMSTAAVSHGFVEYVRIFPGMDAIPRAGLVVAFLAVLSLINDRGIRESTWLTAGLTGASVLALLALGVAGLLEGGTGPGPALGSETGVTGFGVLSAAALAFYAFIGFEDLCNVAEETKTPSRTMPRAVLFSLAITAALYVLVTVSALVVVPIDELARNPAPLALLSHEVFPSVSNRWISGIAILAVANTALFNLIMASRVMYGMAQSGWLPAPLGRIGRRTRTPRLAVLLAFCLAATLALTGMLGVLAEATNAIILMAFIAVNLSLIFIRRRGVPPDEDATPTFVVPLVVPAVGVVLNVVLLTQLSFGAYLRAAALVGLGVVLHLVVGRADPEASATEQ